MAFWLVCLGIDMNMSKHLAGQWLLNSYKYSNISLANSSRIVYLYL